MEWNASYLLIGGIGLIATLLGWVWNRQRDYHKEQNEQGERLTRAEEQIKSIERNHELQTSNFRDMRTEIAGAIRDLRADIRQDMDQIWRRIETLLNSSGKGHQ